MITAEQSSHVAAIATGLADLLAPSDIESAERLACLKPAGRTKVARLQSLFLRRLGRGYRADARTLLRALVIRAHENLITTKRTITTDQLEAILTPARALGWVPSELEATKWRTAIRPSVPEQSHDAHNAGTPKRVRPTHHRDAELEVRELLASTTIPPQERGRRLELVVLAILQHERLRPQHSVRRKGEEVDLAFEIDGTQYLLECKWEKDPAGGAHLNSISAKARTRPEGTRAVLLSMSGFVRNIEDLPSRGQQQNVIGLHGSHLMSIVSGHTSWTDVVLGGWRAAARHRQFVAPL